MPIPKSHDIGGWYIPNHAIRRFRERYGWADGSDLDVRMCIREMLQCVGPESIYTFYSIQNRKNMDIYHVIDRGVHSYFLVNPSQRPPAVISVFTLGQFKNFWDELQPEYKIHGPEQEYSRDKWEEALKEKDKKLELLRLKLEQKHKKVKEQSEILQTLRNVAHKLFKWEKD